MGDSMLAVELLPMSALGSLSPSAPHVFLEPAYLDPVVRRPPTLANPRVLHLRRGDRSLWFPVLASVRAGVDVFRFVGHRRSACNILVGDATLLQDYLNAYPATVFVLYDMPTVLAGRRVVSIRLYACPVADWSSQPDFESYAKEAVSKKHRADLRRSAKKLECLGTLDQVVVRGGQAPDDEIGRLLTHCEAIHRARFGGYYRGAFLGAFYARLLRDFPPALLSVLTLDAVPISFVYGYIDESSHTFIDTAPAVDPAFSRYSLGHLHLWRLMRYLADRGVRRFDFSKGAALYKEKWSNSVYHSYVNIFPGGDPRAQAIGKAYAGYYKAISLARDAGITVSLRRLLGRLRGPGRAAVVPYPSPRSDLREVGRFSDIASLPSVLRRAVLEALYRGVRCSVSRTQPAVVEIEGQRWAAR